jgi:glycosyltransferase involved in cell wall biosynthesis
VTRVAVIVPTHDDGHLAAEAVASIRETEPVEIVVVDDGTSDAASLAALRELESRGVRVVRREVAGGPPAARMTGLEASSAPYVFPLDSDDVLEPGALGELADRLDAAPEAAFVWGDYTLFGDQGGRYRSPGAFLPWTVTYVNPYPVSSLFRRSALVAVGGWQARGYEDWDVWLGFAERGLSGVAAGRVIYRRRLHGPGRVGPGDRRKHQELYAELQSRHPALFARRAELRRLERPAVWKRLVYPVLFGSRSVVPFRVEAFLQRTMMRLGLRLSR